MNFDDGEFTFRASDGFFLTLLAAWLSIRLPDSHGMSTIIAEYFVILMLQVLGVGLVIGQLRSWSKPTNAGVKGLLVMSIVGIILISLTVGWMLGKAPTVGGDFLTIYVLTVVLWFAYSIAETEWRKIHLIQEDPERATDPDATSPVKEANG